MIKYGKPRKIFIVIFPRLISFTQKIKIEKHGYFNINKRALLFTQLCS